MPFLLTTTQLVRIGTLAIVAIATASVISWWIGSWRDSSSRIQTATNALARVEWMIEHGKELADRIASDKSALSSYRQSYITADNSEHATAALQRHISDAVSQNGGSILSAQPVSYQADTKIKTVAARFRVTLPASKLQGLLTQLESSLPYLFIDQADISVSPSTAGNNAPLTLTTQFDVHAFWLDASNDK